MVKEAGKKQVRFLTNMKDNFKMIRNLDKVFILGPQAMYIKVIFLMIFAMDMEKCIGQMVAYTKVSGKEVSNMVRVY